MIHFSFYAVITERSHHPSKKAKCAAQDARRLPVGIKAFGRLDGQGDEFILCVAHGMSCGDARGLLDEFMCPALYSLESLSLAQIRLWGWTGETRLASRGIDWMTPAPDRIVVCPRMWRVTEERSQDLLALELEVLRETDESCFRDVSGTLEACARILGRAYRLPFERTVSLALQQASRIHARALSWEDVPPSLEYLNAADCAVCGRHLSLRHTEVYCSVACEAQRCCACSGALLIQEGASGLKGSFPDRKMLSRRLGELKALLAEKHLARSFDKRRFLHWCCGEAGGLPCDCGFRACYNPCSGCEGCVERYLEGARILRLQGADGEGQDDDSIEAECERLEKLLCLPLFGLEAWICKHDACRRWERLLAEGA